MAASISFIGDKNKAPAASLIMKIGIDARLYGIEHAGIGRYIKNLVDRLVATNSTHEYVFFLKEPYFSNLHLPGSFQKIHVDIKHYTLAEQIFLPGIFNSAKLDLLHTPHFNVPLFYRRSFVITIHDILWHHFRGPAVTTLPPLMYLLKYQSYRRVVAHAVTASKAILVPSFYVKNQLLQEFPSLLESKINVTYEGVDLIDQPEIIHQSKPYFLYVGSCYPHKNLPILIEALKRYNSQHKPLNLKIVSSRNVFQKKLSETVREAHMESWVQFTGKLTDAALNQAYGQCLALVQPSLSEGFGLTGLEAMAAGAPVIAARSAALPEIYADAALWFNPLKVDELVESLIAVQNPSLRQSLVHRGRDQALKFSWDNMVEKTKKIYETSLSV